MFDSCSWIITIVTYLSPFIAYNAYKHGPEPYIALVKGTAIPALSIYSKLNGESHTQTHTSNGQISVITGEINLLF